MWYFVFLLVFLFLSCTHNNRDRQELSKPLKIILDTDMGSDCDDVGALALLHHYADQGLVEILGIIYSSGKVPYGAGVIDAINTYYNRGKIPLGASYDTLFGDPADKMNAEKLARDTPAYGHDIVHNLEAGEQVTLIRELLLNSEDKSVVYITIGHTKALFEVLISEGDSVSGLTGHDLLKKKLIKWVAMGAPNAIENDRYFKKDWNFYFNGSAVYTEYVLQHIPVPVHIVGAGGSILSGASLEYTEAGNIVRDAYRDWLWNVEKKTLSDQRPSWDLISVQYTVEGLGEYLYELEEGWLEFDAAKGSRWNFSPDSSVFDHHYIFNKPGSEEALSDYLNSILAK